MRSQGRPRGGDDTGGLVPRDWLERIAGLPAEGGPSGEVWARRAARLVDEVLAQWDLVVTGSAMTGQTAVVLPVEQAGRALVLKVGWPHEESAGEHLALRHWGGRGAVRLVAADPGRGALLLERLDSSRSLSPIPIDEACAVVGSTLRLLHVPAPPTVAPLAAWLGPQVARMGGQHGIPRRIVTRTQGLAGELLADPDVSLLLHTDLHFDNILGILDRPDEWRAIDPKPRAGHPGFEVQPVLRNRIEELGTGSAFRWGIRRRLDIVAEAAQIDPEAARLWSLVHTGIQIGWAAADDDGAGVSLHIAIFKALED